MDKCLKKIMLLIQERSGVDFSKKQYRFTSSVLDVMERYSLTSCEELYRLLKDEERFYEILSSFMVSQSFFNREPGHYEILTDLLHQMPSIRPLILSIPCANGEEPYTIAIYLLKDGLKNFAIKAVDINPQAIERAQRGIYSTRDIASLPSVLVEEFFDPIDRERFRIKDVVRSYVQFEQNNLFELQEWERYDVVFCRNLMIYLEAHKKREAVEIFRRILKPGGYLFLSFSDYVSEMEGFDTISLNDKDIYRKRTV